MGSARFDPEEYGADEREIQEFTRQALGRELNSDRVVAFVGSGVSRAYGHCSWDQLIEHIEQKAQERDATWQPHSSEGSTLHPADRNLLRLSHARRMLDHDALQTILEHHFKRSVPPVTYDPVRNLYDLGIRRFVTTNYDESIEHSIRRLDGSIHVESVECDLDDGTPERILQLAVGAPGYEVGVFHVHGSWRRPEHVVLSEEDYQRIYVRRSPHVSALRDAIEVMLASNPILFVGVGMQEPDLLRPLRQFVAERAGEAREKPLFALLPRSSSDESFSPQERELRRFLRARYGVHTIYYEQPHGPEDQARALCDTLHDLGQDRRDWWGSWRQKPQFRQAACQTVIQEDSTVAILHREQSEDSFETDFPPDALRSRDKRLVVLFGPPGSGKGSLGLRLALGVNDVTTQYKKRFFATLRFRNEFLAVIEAAASFFAGDPSPSDPPAPPLQRLRDALASCDKDQLLVLGGFERLLRRDDLGALVRSGDSEADPPDLKGHTPSKAELSEVKELIDILVRSQSKVVVTTSSWPDPALIDPKQVELVGGLVKERVLAAFVEKSIPKADAEEIYHALDGNAFALIVALKMVEVGGAEVAWIREMTALITSYDRSRRPVRLIGSVIELACREDPSGLTRSVIQHAALVTTPVSAEAVAAAIQEPDPERIRETLEQLVRRALIIPIQPPLPISNSSQGVRKRRYTAHTLVRSHVASTLGGYRAAVGEAHRFGLPAPSAETEPLQHPTESAHALVTESVDNLLAACEVEKQRSDPDPDRVRALIRMCFGLMRARWSAVALGQLWQMKDRSDLPHYDGYQYRLVRLANLVRASSAGSWRFSGESQEKLAHDAVLYADELAWLYNELGLVSYIQGYLREAQSVWAELAEIGMAAEHVGRTRSPSERGRRWRQTQLYLALVAIERGQLQRASDTLKESLPSARRAKDSDSVVGRMIGHLGWVHHLQGDLSGAMARYDTAIELMRTAGVHRGRSIFLRLRGAVHYRLDDPGTAGSDFQEAVAVAELGGYLDLAQHARLAQAILGVRTGTPGEGLETGAIERVLAFAERMGIPKLEAEAYRALGEVALKTGDFQRAHDLAGYAISIAARLGMKLKVTAILVLMARIARARSCPVGSAAMFNAAARLGRSQRYHLQVEEAEAGLRTLSRPPLPGG